MSGDTRQPPAGDSPEGDAAPVDRDTARATPRPERPTPPEITSDETAGGWGDWREDRDDDDRLLREVPPHHGTY